MCPPSLYSPAEISSYWCDKEIILSLDEYIRGSLLPENVIEDIDPYMYNPSDLPSDIWYFVRSNDKRRTGFGFWRAKGEACEVYSDTRICGWRTTLEFFEGQAPAGLRTDWIMQEYKITQKRSCGENKLKEPSSLCRVFLSHGQSGENEICPKLNEVDVAGQKPLEITSSTNESQAKEVHESQLGTPEDQLLNSSLDNLLEQEYFRNGDFLELDDLAEPETRSSSSDNSSCQSRASDEYFDSLALLQDLEDYDNNCQKGKDASANNCQKGKDASANNCQKGKDASAKYIYTASVTSDEVVMPPCSSGFPINVSGNKSAVEGCLNRSAAIAGLTGKQVLEHAAKRLNAEGTNAGTSRFNDISVPSTSHNKKIVRKEENQAKTGSNRMKKLKLYFCFSAF